MANFLDFFIPAIYVLHKLVCKLLHKWASWYFHASKASENAAHKCNNCNKHSNGELLDTLCVNRRNAAMLMHSGS